MYTWQLVFDRLDEQGPMRVVKLFKVGLQEMPRLERAFLSSVEKEHQEARDEVLALFRHIDIEMQKAIKESTLSEQEFTKEVKKNSNFTPEEWAKLARIPELIGKHHKELFDQRAFDTPKKRNPFFKV